MGQPAKINGNFGFRARVATNQVGDSGNVVIDQTRAYPSGATLDADGNTVLQQPIAVSLTDVHTVRTTMTVVGTITGVAAEPYSLLYRLSQDATMYITITNTAGPASENPVVRQLVNALPRLGEGIPDGNLQNGDAWNGRADNGDLMPSGIYLATLQAYSRDQYGYDLSAPTTIQIGLDPLQVTDILVQPLTGLSTSLAVLTYTLTEPATVYIDIYPPGTQFCNGLGPVNDASVIPDQAEPNPPKDFGPALGACGSPISPLRSIVEQKNFRVPVVSFWDGRDSAGRIMPDGDYVFVLYAALPSQNGFDFLGSGDKRIWTSMAKSGYITIARGLVTISQVGPSSTVIGSSPSVAGLNPFMFTYSLSRDAIVNLNIYDTAGTSLKKSLVINQPRPGNFLNREVWDGTGDDGLVLPAGNYLAELSAADPFFPVKVTTTSAVFPLNLFRIVDVMTTPLLTGTTDVATLSYQLSQGMNMSWNIYPPGTVISGSAATWPPCGLLKPGVCGQTVHNGAPIQPLVSVSGMRPGRLRISEFWDGRDINGLFIPDGNYPFTLIAQSTTTPQYFAQDRIMGNVTVARGSVIFALFNVKPNVPVLYNSSQTVTLPPYEIDYELTRQSSVTIRILDTRAAPVVVRNIIAGQVRDSGIINQEFWDAKDDRNNFVAPGFYTVQAIAQDLASISGLSSGSTVQQTITVDPLRIYDVAVSPLLRETGSALIAYQVSETMKVAVKIFKPGTNFDSNGNALPPDAVSLVRRIVGVRPSRTAIEEIWDGKDEKLSLVPDGNYVFRIVGSTDLASIDTLTGNVQAGASLATDLVLAEVPVVRGQSLDPEADFKNNTFMYPNPVSGSQATFNIYAPFQSDVSLKIFNIAGELVYEKSFPNQPPSYNNPGGAISFVWPKTNAAGRQVAPGVYFVLIREEETFGGANVLQTVKKMLVQ